MKRVFALILAAILALAVVGCGKNGTKTPEETKEIDVTELAAALAERVTFKGEIKPLPEKRINDYVTLPEGAKAAAYMGSGTTVDEIFVVQCAAESDGQTAKEAVEAYLASQLEEKTLYPTEETARLKKALLVQRGDCVVLCVTDDTQTAETVIKEYLG